MALGRRESSHSTQLSALHAAGAAEGEYSPGQRVMTCDGIPGIVASIEYQPLMGAELYQVTLEGGAGGGLYSSSQLSPMTAHIAAGAHLASEDYPELEQVLAERPDIAVNTHLGSLQATAGFKVEQPHDAVPTTRGHETHINAVDEDSGAHGGYAHYYAPKRKGGPVQINSLSGNLPGAGSHLLDHIEAQHPGSPVKFINERKRGKNTPQNGGNGKHGLPTDWDEHHENIEGVHRGFALRLPSHDAKTVNSPESDPQDHVHALTKALQGPTGMHWTSSHDMAKGFAHGGVTDYRTDIPVVLHGERPERKDIETRPGELFRNGVFPHGHGEAEVPMRKGRKVTVTGMSWKPDATHPDADEKGWLHHTFPEPMTRTAAFDEDDQSFRMQHRAPGPGQVPYRTTNDDPDEKVRIYRGLPHGVNRFQQGDWVTTDPDYAHQHSYQNGQGGHKWPVITHEVPAHHLWTDENDPQEQGYHGPAIHEPDFHHPDHGVVPFHAAEEYEGGEHHFHQAPESPEVHTGTAVHLSPEDHAIVHDKNRTMDERARHLYSKVPMNNLLFNGDHEHADEAASEGDYDAYQHVENGVPHHDLTHLVLHHHEGNGGQYHGISWGHGGDEGFPLYPGEYTHHTLLGGAHYGSLDSRNSWSTLEGGEEGGHHVGGRGKPRADGRGAGAGVDPEDQFGGGQRAVAPRDEHAGQRVVGAAPVTFHPAALKELKKLDNQTRKQVNATISDLEQGRPTQTHLLSDKLRGWSGTKASRGHRIVHRKGDDGSHYIGHVGLHEYETAIRRLTNQQDGGFEDIGDASNEDGIISDGLAPAMSSFDPYDLLTTASADPEFGFHFTAAWVDVRRKAKRIRSEGRVRITLASDGLVIGEVKGDHHTYETGVQRFPGSRNSIATYSCGCKWGAYHWGADDDFSRFAGRMCSHALALQFEAQSRGMFGRDVETDSHKPEWVPRNVVVKWDIDDDRNQMARSSSLLEETPLIAFARWAEEQGGHPDEIALAVHAAGFAYSFEVEASTNSPFGDPVPQPMTYQPGPTKPPNASDNPGSAGWATMGDPDGWDSISPNELGDRTASIPQGVAQSDSPQGLQGDDAPDGWDSISPTAERVGPPRPSGPKGGTGGDMPPGHAGMPQHRDLAEATLHMEPEGALPFTDGDGPELSDDESLTPSHTASLGLEQLQAMLGHLNPDGGSAGPYTPVQADLEPVPEGDIAAAARQHLAKLAVKDYSPAEQAAIINEGAHVRAANLDRLDIKDTHYAHNGPEDEEWLN